MLRKRLLNERAAGVTRGEEIRAAAEAEGREFTAEELAEFAKLKDRRAAIDAQLAVLEEQREADRTMAAVGESSSASNAVANITHVHDNRQDKPWASSGEQLLAIARAGFPHGEVDPRLMAATPTGASVSENSAGGFLMHSEYSEQLLSRAREESPILSMCRDIPIGAGIDSIDLPVIDETSRATGSRWGGVQVYRRAEAQAVTATKPKFGRLKLEPAEIAGLAYATDRLLRNAATVETVFNDSFASEFAFKVTDEILRGTGGDECLGILDAAASGIRVTQAIETGQTLASSALVSKNISNMWSRIPARSKARGVWCVNAEVGPWLDELSIPAGTGALEPRFVNYDNNGAIRIKGRPVVELEQCSALGTVGDFFFADFGEYLLATKGQIEGQSSMHVQFIYNEMTFRWTYYISGKPAWLSAVSAYKGSASKSPFVMLDTRT
jgi:HK97 family phage major capsid protein